MTRAKDISKVITGTTVTDLTVGSSEPDLIIQDTDGTNQLMKIQQVGGASMIKTRSGSNDGEFYITGEVTGTNKMKISTSGQAYLYGSLDVSGAFTSQGIDDNADATAITIDSSERVNIGTGTPPTADSVFTVQKSSAANEFNVISSPTHASVINLGDTDDYNICRIKGDNSNNSLQFQTNNAERMRIDSSGNVGVGTSSPVNNLHIQGSSGLRIVNSDDTSNLSILGFDNNESPVLNLYSNNAVTAKIHSEGNSYFNGGNTGFGISSPLGRIHVKQHNTAYGIVVEANGNDAWLRLHHNNSIGIVETTYNSSAGFTPLTFKVANSERMRIDTSGRVMIGNTTEGVAGADELTVGNTSAGNGITIRSASNSSGALFFSDGTSGASEYDGGFEYNHSSQFMRISTAGAERMRIDADGDVAIGTTTNGVKLRVKQTTGNQVISTLEHDAGSNPFGSFWSFSGASPDNNSSYFLKCQDSSADRLYIYSDGDVYNHDGTFAQISDRRIKDNITDANAQWNDIKAMRFVNYQRKDDIRQYGADKAKVQLGLIGQELEEVSPNLVRSIDPNEGDILCSSEFGSLYEDGDTIPEGSQKGDVKEVKDKVKGVAYSILYMKAVKALQEAMTRIEKLEARITTLEGA